MKRDVNFYTEKYVDLLIKRAIKLEKGECIELTVSPFLYEFALVFAKKSYEGGAKYVSIKIDDSRLLKSRLINSENENIKYVPSQYPIASLVKAYEKWTTVRIANCDQLDELNEVEKDKVQLYSKSIMEHSTALRESAMSGARKWLVCCYPSAMWAKFIFGSASEENLEKLWDVFISIMRLDEEDPAEFWNKHILNLEAVAKKLNDEKIEYLHFKNPNADLKVYLTENSLWKSGGSFEGGQVYLNNIPTEEVFTTPNYKKTEGFVKACRPVNVKPINMTVEGAYFEFKEGRVIKYDADKGKDVLDSFFSIDDGSRYLGELALVDCRGPIFGSGLNFQNILFDENASCHIAFGKGYPICIKDAESMGKEKLKELCNDSFVHVDFMIGTLETDVYAKTFDGREFQVMKEGKMIF